MNPIQTKGEEEEVIIIADPPPPPPRKLLGRELTADAGRWASKWSTWLAVLSAMATAGLGAYALQPARAQELVPEWALAVLSVTAVLSAVLIPLATSLQQRKP